MAKKKKKESSVGEIFSDLKEDTVRGLWGIISLSAALFFFLAAVDLAGIAGEKTHAGLVFLFGVGYFLLPVALLYVSFSFFRSYEHRLSLLKGIGVFVFLLAGLALIDIALPDKGGIVGSMIASPLVALFDMYAAILVLIALLLISLVVLFDFLPRFSFSLLSGLFSRIEDTAIEEGDYDIETFAGEEGEGEEGASEEGDVEGEVEEDPAGGLFGFGKKDPSIASYVSFEEYTPPPLSLLEKDKGKPDVGDVKANANIIKRTLQNFGIQVEMDEISIGPTVTRYALKPAEGVRLSKILALQNNLELALAAHPVRIEAPIPGKSLVGIEVPNTLKSTIGLGSLISDEQYSRSSLPLLVSLGRDISGHSHFANLARMPHLLLAGATGAGKSVTIHAIVTSLLFRNPPENLKFIMIDPKRVELTMYNNIPHLLTPVITDLKKAIMSLKWASKEMERRYDILEKEAVRDMESSHKNIVEPPYAETASAGKPAEDDLPDRMPYIVIIIDELADMMSSYPREMEGAIVRLAQMSRAVGIHLLLSTQRPSVEIITGLIKANIPSRIALQVASQIDSRTILDMAGAEKLLASGDMLYLSGDMSKPVRLQSAFISEREAKRVVGWLKHHYRDEIPQDISVGNESVSGGGSGRWNDGVGGDDDELYEEARLIIMEAGKASASYLQRRLKVGYARAARLLDMLEERGVIGPADGAKPREVFNRENIEGVHEAL